MIDFFNFCSELLPFLQSVIVDEERKFTRTRFGIEKGQKIVKESDHNPLKPKSNFFLKDVTKERRDMFNFYF